MFCTKYSNWILKYFVLDWKRFPQVLQKRATISGALPVDIASRIQPATRAVIVRRAGANGIQCAARMASPTPTLAGCITSRADTTKASPSSTKAFAVSKKSYYVRVRHLICQRRGGRDCLG